MRFLTRAARAILAIVGTTALAASAFATNGYFTHGVGTQSKAMAGTGIGSPVDMGAIMTASNPALGVFVSDDWEAGLAIFSPRRSYEASAIPPEFGNPGDLLPLPGGGFFPAHTINPGKVDSSSEYFPIPYVAKNFSLANDANVTAAFYGRGGMNTNWDDPNASATSYFCGGDPSAGDPPATGRGPYCGSLTGSDGVAGVDLMQAFLAVNYSAKLSDNFSWGAGPIIAIQMFEAKGVTTFAPVTKTCASTFDPNTGACTIPTALSNNDHDTSIGLGFAAGVWWGITDTVSLGLSYQSKISMGEFDDYADLFAEAGDFDIPSSIKAGLSFLATDALRVNLDVEHTAFGDVDSVGNPMMNLAGCPSVPLGGTNLENCLGGAAGAGFGWDDMTTYKVGFEWRQSEMNTWRFGYSYGEQPVQPDDVLFNILAPGVMEQHITFGLTRQTNGGSAWSFSFMYAPENSVTGTSMFDPRQTIELTMDQFEFELAYRF
jgi:long-chain fatty acid transport protein